MIRLIGLILGANKPVSLVRGAGGLGIILAPEIVIPALVFTGIVIGSGWLINKYGPSLVDGFGSLFKKNSKSKKNNDDLTDRKGRRNPHDKPKKARVIIKEKRKNMKSM